MKENIESFSIKNRIKSFKHAIDGIVELFKSQHNARIHLLATSLVILTGFLLSISAFEWCLLILSVALVFVTEALNTGLEFVCDVASPEIHPLIKKSKDVAAGAVLISSISAVLIGLIIFIPYISAIL